MMALVLRRGKQRREKVDGTARLELVTSGGPDLDPVPADVVT